MKPLHYVAHLNIDLGIAEALIDVDADLNATDKVRQRKYHIKIVIFS